MPKSVGAVTLRSADPAAAPIIDCNFLADDADVRVLLAGIRLARRIIAAAPFDPYRGIEQFPVPKRRATRSCAPISGPKRRRSIIPSAPARWAAIRFPWWMRASAFTGCRACA